MARSGSGHSAGEEHAEARAAEALLREERGDVVRRDAATEARVRHLNPLCEAGA